MCLKLKWCYESSLFIGLPINNLKKYFVMVTIGNSYNNTATITSIISVLFWFYGTIIVSSSLARYCSSCFILFIHTRLAFSSIFFFLVFNSYFRFSFHLFVFGSYLVTQKCHVTSLIKTSFKSSPCYFQQAQYKKWRPSKILVDRGYQMQWMHVLIWTL